MSDRLETIAICTAIVFVICFFMMLFADEIVWFLLSI